MELHDVHDISHLPKEQQNAVTTTKELLARVMNEESMEVMMVLVERLGGTVYVPIRRLSELVDQTHDGEIGMMVGVDPVKEAIILKLVDPRGKK